MFPLILLLVLSQVIRLNALVDFTEPGLVVDTTAGPVRGRFDTNTTSVPLKKWYGMRFAQDTSGANRWRPPQPPAYNFSIFNATSFGPACMQGRSDGGNGTSIQGEDCLGINIIAPENATGLPVYLYAYGGGFDSGASSDPKSMALSFPQRGSYSPAKETQNFGLLDTRAAVEWVRDNVKAFGGDPKKITLGGESIGAEMTNQYMSAFYEDPIIQGAVMQSADRHGELNCLRTKPAIELQTALLATGKQFQPVTDNITIFEDYVKQTRRGTVAKIPLLIGTNKDEGTLIVEGEPTANNELAYITSNNLNVPWADPEKLLELFPVPSDPFPTAINATAGMWRDVHMLCLASDLAKWRVETLKQPVWRYRFDLVANNLNSRGTRIGAFHGSDIRFVMGTTDTIVLSPPFMAATPFQKMVSDLMVEAWTNFVKDPHLGPRIPGWRKYDTNHRETLAILGISSDKADIGDSFTADSSCKYWNTVLPIFPQTFPVCGNWTC